MCAHTYCGAKNVQYWCSTSPGAHEILQEVFVQVSASFSKSGHLDHFGLSKVAKMTIWPEMSTSAVCACVQILTLGLDTIITHSLDPKGSANRSGDSLGMFRHHFWKTFFWGPKTHWNSRFCRNFCIENVCLCVHIYLFWGVILSAPKV